MKLYQTHKNSTGFRNTLNGTIVIFCLSLILGCNEAPNSPGDASEYSIQAHVVRDVNLNISIVRASYWHNDSLSPSGPVTLDATVINQAGNALFQVVMSGATSIDSGLHSLKLEDGGVTIADLTLNVPDTFGITMNDTTRIYNGVGNVTVEILPLSINTGGYIVAAVKATDVYINAGYAEFIPLGITSGNIPPEVFRDPLDANVLDTGLYYVYVYAYSGSPQVDSITGDLPTVLPASGFPNNLSSTLISGKYGGLTISRRDSVFVQQL